MEFLEVKRILESHIDEIRSFGVKELGIFGSVANGTNTNNSDIDILVDFYEVPRISKAYFGLKFYLKDLLKSEIDLCRKKDLRVELKEDILRSVKYVS